jgi:hypothetical protein
MTIPNVRLEAPIGNRLINNSATHLPGAMKDRRKGFGIHQWQLSPCCNDSKQNDKSGFYCIHAQPPTNSHIPLTFDIYCIYITIVNAYFYYFILFLV